MEWTIDGFKRLGFEGFIPVSRLGSADIPQAPGVYVVLRPSATEPEFLVRSPAGPFKGVDPTVPENCLREAWVEGAQVVYVGMAGSGSSGRRGLRTRLSELRRYGEGKNVGHRGGEWIWQLEDHSRLLVAWTVTSADDARPLERNLIDGFRQNWGKWPFANRRS